MHDEIRQFFGEVVPAAKERLRQIEAGIDPTAIASKEHESYRKISSAINDLLGACSRLDWVLTDEAMRCQARSDFQAAFFDCFSKGWLVDRAISKPRGYPGDYKMLTGIYDFGPVATGFAGYLDIFFLDILLARSIRSRWQDIRRFLTEELSLREGKVSVLNIASGPLREFASPLELTGSSQIHLQCLDNDQEALDYVRENVAPTCGLKELKLDRYNALRLKSAKSTERLYGKFDVIYSIGLFDYIDDQRLIEILRGVRALLNEGGVIYLNFKDSERYNSVEYQWLLDWHFFQRTEEDCLKLFELAGYPMDRMEPTSRDETGVIINFVNRANPTMIRIDDAHAVPKPKLSIASKRASKRAKKKLGESNQPVD